MKKNVNKSIPLALYLHVINNIYIFIYNIHFIKGTVSVISSDPQCKEGNARFTTVPLKPLCVRRVQHVCKIIETRLYSAAISCVRCAEFVVYVSQQTKHRLLTRLAWWRTGWLFTWFIHGPSLCYTRSIATFHDLEYTSHVNHG